MSLSNRLKTLFTLNPDKSQADLARFANVRPPSVNDWVSGKTKKMSGPALMSVSIYFGVDAMWLATGEGKNPLLQSNATQPPVSMPNQAASAEITNHSAINSGASLLDGLRVLAECLEGMEQSDRKAAIAMLWRLETEPQSYAKVAAQIEVMRGTAFTPQLRKQA